MTAKTAVTPSDDEPIDAGAEITQLPVGKVQVLDFECPINRMKTREMFSLIRLLTFGGENVSAIASIFSKGKSEEAMAQELMATLLISIPKAEADFVTLIRQMVGRPDNITDDQWLKIQREIANPEIETTMSVVQSIVEQESGELSRLGKAARSWWATVGPTIKKNLKTTKDSDS